MEAVLCILEKYVDGCGSRALNEGTDRDIYTRSWGQLHVFTLLIS
jgi:hypothetical protein